MLRAREPELDRDPELDRERDRCSELRDEEPGASGSVPVPGWEYDARGGAGLRFFSFCRFMRADRIARTSFR